jgi:hypothetical protein
MLLNQEMSHPKVFFIKFIHLLGGLEWKVLEARKPVGDVMVLLMRNGKAEPGS